MKRREICGLVFYFYFYFFGGGWGVVELDSVNLGFGGNCILLWFILIK